MGLIEKLFGKTKRMSYENYPQEYEHEIWVRDTGTEIEYRNTRPKSNEPYAYAWSLNTIQITYRARREVKDD